MTADQLIQLLLKYPPETPIVGKSDNFELNGSDVDVRGVNEYKGKLVEKQFTDGFDYERYTKKVWDTRSIMFDKSIPEDYITVLKLSL